mmetsp:Transcript_7558/g.27608  ORF Transcript_7558/g.27608 Transcript_7558/m.27608 type:complete len:209 (+) Transcript_7558:468-1094(+)
MPTPREVAARGGGRPVVVRADVHGGHPGRAEPRVPVDLRGRDRERRRVRRPEFLARRRRELVLLEVRPQKRRERVRAVRGVERVLLPVTVQPRHVLQVHQERESLLVRDLAEHVVRVDAALQRRLQHSVRMLGAQPRHRLLQLHQSPDRVEVEDRLAVQLVHDLPLHEHREPLVQPEVLPRAVRDEVAAPAVRDLVRDDVRLASIARE